MFVCVCLYLRVYVCMYVCLKRTHREECIHFLNFFLVYEQSNVNSLFVNNENIF